MEKFGSSNQQTSWHQVSLDDLCSIFKTDLKGGLSQSEAIERGKLEGANRLPEREKTHPVILFLKEITNWFAILLWVGAFLSILIYALAPAGNEANVYLAGALMGVILITGSITYLQSAKSEALMEQFKQMLPASCRVVRDGRILNLPAVQLVRGDLVQIENGEKIPADLRIVQSLNMKVDNSSLTGETNLLLRTIQESDAKLLESSNIAFFGTYCRHGRGKGIVVEIGAATYMGKVADLSLGGKKEKSPLQVELDRFVLMITIIAGVLGTLFIVLSRWVVGYSLLDCMIFGIGIIVANVPEGILACVTISLAITAKKLADKNVLVKTLEAVETLGSTSCICSDKTGTLTMNKMAVSHSWCSSKLQNLAQDVDIIRQLYSSSSDFKLLLHTSILSSKAFFEQKESLLNENHSRIAHAKVIGDASETALIRFGQQFTDVNKLREDEYISGYDKEGHPAFHHFDSVKKYSYGIAKNRHERNYCIFMKGAPQKIWKYCSHVRINGKNQPITQELSKLFKQSNEQMSQVGERVLGFAYIELDERKYPQNYKFDLGEESGHPNFQLDNLTFVGLLSLADPPKPGVLEAVRKCRASGVKVVMVTGDQSATAVAIARQVGIITLKSNLQLQKEGFNPKEAINKANAVSISGTLIDEAFALGRERGEESLDHWLRKTEIVFSRTTPVHKLRIVEACQRVGWIVGVTGDGVNDAAAIKQADIGISMGISGSAVTQQAADMVLLDDDFSSIVGGIEEGRKVFDNLKKTIVYLLTSNSTQIWPFLFMVLLRMPLPLSNIFMLCICVGTDIYPALALAYEEPQLDLLARPPRHPQDRLVSIRMLVHAYGLMGSMATAAGLFTYCVIMEVYGFPPSLLIGLLAKSTLVPLGPTGQSDLTFNRVIGYDPSSSDLGNPFLPGDCSSASFSSQFPDWLKATNNRYDLRAAYNQCCPPPNERYFCSMFNWPIDVLDTISSITNSPVAFTTEALLYAQSGYFAAVVLVQWSNIFACKSRKLSFVYSESNVHIFGGVMVETIMLIGLLYTPGVNQIFGGRPLNFWLMGIPGLCFSMLLLCWQEGRKFMINNDVKCISPNWCERHIFW